LKKEGGGGGGLTLNEKSINGGRRLLLMEMGRKKIETRISYYWTPDLWSTFKQTIVTGKSHKAAQVYKEGHDLHLLIYSKLKTKSNFFLL